MSPLPPPKDTLTDEELRTVMGRGISDEELFWRDWTRFQSEQRWRVILRQAEDDYHVSREVLLDLIRKWGVPAFAGGYVADRWSGRIAPPGNPAKPPVNDPRFPEWANDHFMEKFRAVGQVWRRERRYRAFATPRPPNESNVGRLSHDPERDVWTVKAPKREAQERVSKRVGVSPSTLKDWERQCRQWRDHALSPSAQWWEFEGGSTPGG